MTGHLPGLMMVGPENLAEREDNVSDYFEIPVGDPQDGELEVCVKCGALLKDNKWFIRDEGEIWYLCSPERRDLASVYCGDCALKELGRVGSKWGYPLEA